MLSEISEPANCFLFEIQIRDRADTRKFPGRMALRSFGRLDTKHTLYILCDVQERFRAVSHNFSSILTNAQKLISCGRLLNVNLIVSEQNPDKLGRTASELNIDHAVGIYDKLEFSIMGNPKLRDIIKNMSHVKSIVLFGLETHVCIEQTAADLLANGYDVHIVADCTTSRTTEDRNLAFQRLRQIGCYVTTSESVIFKLLGTKSNPLFSQIRPLVLNASVPTGLATAFHDLV